MNAPFDLDEDLELPVAPTGFQVTDEASAAWATDKVLAAEARVERLKAQAGRNIARAEKELARAREFFEPMLRAWAWANPPRRGRTIHLATGDVGFRRVNGGIFVEDEKAVLEWAIGHLPEAVYRAVVTQLDKARCKREGERIFTKACEDQFMAADMPADPMDAVALTARLLDEAARALPPGMVRRQDEEKFEVRSPKGGK